ncbi:unnamed protein product, partial [Rotaria sp. Silwood2]
MIFDQHLILFSVKDLAMVTDSEVRNKLLELVKLLAAAGVFNAKNGTNPMNAFSNVTGLL